MRQHRWIELFSDYDYEIRYHLGKANVVADALSRKERIKPKRVWAMNMTIRSSIKVKILEAQSKASEAVDAPTEMLRGLEEQMERRINGALLRLNMLQQPEIPEWKWERIAIDFVMKLPSTSSRHDSIWVIVDRLTKSAHFLPMCEDYNMDKLARLYLNEIVARHGVPISIISDRDGRFTSRFWQCASFEALCGRKCRSPILWAEVGKGQLIGPEIMQETTEKISQIKDRLRATCDCQKSYADKRRKPLEFSVVDHIPLEGIQVDAKLNIVEEPLEILEREIKKLKRSSILIVKVRWNSKRRPEYTWEREDQMKFKYPHLFNSSSN
ncbi:putative reverse transcriptase domain-containing protein [Tanacetum coccineum]